MSLTSSTLVWVLALTALALLVVVASGWPLRGARLGQPVGRGRGWGAGRVGTLATRTGVALLLNAVVVLIAFLLLNDQYLFYTSWSDLLGAQAQQVVALHGGAASAAVAGRLSGPGLGTVRGTPSYALPTPGARLQRYTVTDPASGAGVPVDVYLPRGYDPASAREYPVVLGLHGFPGVPGSFVHNDFLATADTLEATHRLAPTIFVIPQIDDPRTVDTECTNGPPGDPQAETWLSSVVPRWAVLHLHVRRDRTSWATLGNSYGGWCAAAVAMRHPAVFGAAVVFEGYFEPDFLAGYDPLGPAALRRYDLVRMARHAPPPLAMWVFASRQDSLAYPTTARFLAAARAPLSVTATIVPTGGHRASVFNPYISSSFTWLAHTLPGFGA